MTREPALRVGLSAVVSACHAVVAGDGDLFVAGGVESMIARAARDGEARARVLRAETRRSGTRRSAGASRIRAWRRCSRSSRWARRARTWPSATASRREEQDAFALQSQQRWAAADCGREIRRRAGAGRARPFATSTRGLTRAREKLAALKPAFRKGGSVTAGNSSGLNDGAAALVIASEERARELGAEPLAAFVGSAVAGVDPRVMGIGPIPAVRKLLERSGVGVGASSTSSS